MVRLLLASLVCLACISQSAPIMVSFGTKGGPIEPPPQPASTTELPRDKWREPAPVHEKVDDIPPPRPYKPLPPHIYKKLLYKHKPGPDIAYGTPLDRSNVKTGQYDPPRQAAVGLDYRGPQTFVPQEYEREQQQQQQQRQQQQQNKWYSQQSYSQTPQSQPQQSPGVHYTQMFIPQSVPQIGILYSSGVRYYVPQVVYAPLDQLQEDDVDNSLHHANHLKMILHNQRNNYHFY